MTSEFGNKIRNISGGARWAIAAAAALVFLGISTLCSMTGLLMMTIATDACSSFPDWLNTYIILPPAMMALGSILAPLLFAMRQKWLYVIGSFFLSWFLSIILYIAWLPIVSTQC